jgi:Aspartyl protease
VRSVCSRLFSHVFALTWALALLSPLDALSANGDAVLDAPPPGLVPTTATLAAILAAHDKAAGSSGGASEATVEKWTFTDAGVAGNEVLQRSGTNYHSTIVRGPFVEQYGQVDGKRWHQDANGFTSAASGIEDPSFTAVRVLEDAADPKNDVTVIGETSGANPAYVLQIKRPGFHHPEWVYYDKSTAQIVRVEFVSGKRRDVQEYDDFRSTGGVTQAWHMHDTDGRPELDDDWRLVEFKRGLTVPSAVFAPPPNPENAAVAARAPIPSTFVGDDTVIVRLQVAGRGLDFELDASEPESIIDRSVAEELGLPTYGQVTRLADGQPIGYETILPDANLGPARLHDFRLLVEGFTYKARADTRVVGLLGYDFLANHVVHVDYVHDLVEIFPTQAFGNATPVDGGLDLPISFDDGLLLVPMQFGATFTDKVIVNNAFPYTLAFGPFYSEHSADFHDLFRTKEQRDVPFADGDTVGQRFEVWVTQTASLRFAIADFGSHLFLATNLPYDAYQTNVDAMIGADYLHYFDLYFDYPHGRFIVKPNSWFYDKFKKVS